MKRRILATVVATVTAIVLATTAYAPAAYAGDGYVCFYADNDYRGNYLCRNNRSYMANLDYVGLSNVFSSARNYSGIAWCAYTGINYSGDRYYFWSGASWNYFGSPFNDNIESIRPC